MRLEQVIGNHRAFRLKGNVGIPSPNPSFYKWSRDPERLSELPKVTQLVRSRGRIQKRFQCPSIAHARDHVDRGSPDFLTPRPGLDSFCHLMWQNLLIKKKKLCI